MTSAQPVLGPRHTAACRCEKSWPPRRTYICISALELLRRDAARVLLVTAGARVPRPPPLEVLHLLLEILLEIVHLFRVGVGGRVGVRVRVSSRSCTSTTDASLLAAKASTPSPSLPCSPLAPRLASLRRPGGGPCGSGGGGDASGLAPGTKACLKEEEG